MTKRIKTGLTLLVVAILSLIGGVTFTYDVNQYHSRGTVEKVVDYSKKITGQQSTYEKIVASAATMGGSK